MIVQVGTDGAAKSANGIVLAARADGKCCCGSGISASICACTPCKVTAAFSSITLSSTSGTWSGSLGTYDLLGGCGGFIKVFDVDSHQITFTNLGGTVSVVDFILYNPGPGTSPIGSTGGSADNPHGAMLQVHLTPFCTVGTGDLAAKISYASFLAFGITTCDTTTTLFNVNAADGDGGLAVAYGGQVDITRPGSTSCSNSLPVIGPLALSSPSTTSLAVAPLGLTLSSGDHAVFYTGGQLDYGDHKWRINKDGDNKYVIAKRAGTGAWSIVADAPGSTEGYLTPSKCIVGELGATTSFTADGTSEYGIGMTLAAGATNPVAPTSVFSTVDPAVVINNPFNLPGLAGQPKFCICETVTRCSSNTYCTEGCFDVRVRVPDPLAFVALPSGTYDVYYRSGAVSYDGGTTTYQVNAAGQGFKIVSAGPWFGSTVGTCIPSIPAGTNDLTVLSDAPGNTTMYSNPADAQAANAWASATVTLSAPGLLGVQFHADPADDTNPALGDVAFTICLNGLFPPDRSCTWNLYQSTLSITGSGDNGTNGSGENWSTPVLFNSTVSPASTNPFPDNTPGVWQFSGPGGENPCVISYLQGPLCGAAADDPPDPPAPTIDDVPDECECLNCANCDGSYKDPDTFPTGMTLSSGDTGWDDAWSRTISIYQAGSTGAGTCISDFGLPDTSCSFCRSFDGNGTAKVECVQIGSSPKMWRMTLTRTDGTGHDGTVVLTAPLLNQETPPRHCWQTQSDWTVISSSDAHLAGLAVVS